MKERLSSLPFILFLEHLSVHALTDNLYEESMLKMSHTQDDRPGSGGHNGSPGFSGLRRSGNGIKHEKFVEHSLKVNMHNG
jgi:hypothetical protein